MDTNASDRPRVSILIPNFNNGRASSRTGERDFIGDLLQSLESTLRNDSSPFEILVFDDGSTDDSIETLRDWAENRTWPDGRPFLRLLEAPHCGILSITANKLYREARGEFLVRLDGDIICLTPGWVTRLCEVFDHAPPDVGIIGPKQLATNFHIHAMGDWILHPKGYHHIGFGLPRFQIRRAIEVDHVMGCFYCCRRRTWEEVGEFDEKMLRGQTIDFGLRARLLGWKCWAIPDIEFIHAHSERQDRETHADTGGGIDDSLEYFENKWGFSRISPDLDIVRRQYHGTPLLWNARWFDSIQVTDPLAVWARAWPAPSGSLRLETSDWPRFTTDEAFKNRTMLRAKCVLDVARQAGTTGPIVHLCCGTGLVGHILAQQGLTYHGLDIHRSFVEFAHDICHAQDYLDSSAPRFSTIDDDHELPVEDDSTPLVALTDQIERHPNPVGLLKEIRRILRPGGHLVIISDNRVPSESNEMQEEHFYLIPELINQVRSIRGFTIVSQIDAAQQIDHLLLAAQFIPVPDPEYGEPTVAAAIEAPALQ